MAAMPEATVQILFRHSNLHKSFLETFPANASECSRSSPRKRPTTFGSISRRPAILVRNLFGSALVPHLDQIFLDLILILDLTYF